MTTAYYKRYRMMVDLSPRRSHELSNPPPEPVLPPGYAWAAWPRPFNPVDDEAFIERHAQTKARCFANELDAGVFACLSHLDGCRRLVREIRRKRGFLADATWLIVAPNGEDCATIQGVLESGWLGSIQNVGVAPAHRGRGLGKALVIRALDGFARNGATKATLEVTAANLPAIALYDRLGFRRTRTSYKAVERVSPSPTSPQLPAAMSATLPPSCPTSGGTASCVTSPPRHGVIVVPTTPIRPLPPSSTTQGFGP